jgi:hypothetical protein
VFERRLSIAAVLILGAVTAFAQAANPLAGTWKLNVEKSKGTTFKAGTTRIEAAGDSVTFTVDTTMADGKVMHWSFTANYDGKDVAVKGTNPYGDTVALSRVDARTTRVTAKKAGKVTATLTIAVAADGKTRTTSAKGTDADGKPIDTVSFYEKQ